jgi:hypothetical protein
METKGIVSTEDQYIAMVNNENNIKFESIKWKDKIMTETEHKVLRKLIPSLKLNSKEYLNILMKFDQNQFKNLQSQP